MVSIVFLALVLTVIMQYVSLQRAMIREQLLRAEAEMRRAMVEQELLRAVAEANGLRSQLGQREK
jgi:hypothetical protein